MQSLMRTLTLLLAMAATVVAWADERRPDHSRLGFLVSESVTAQSGRIEALRAGLRELGYVEGRNLVIETRSADGRYERLPALAEDLVTGKVDVIVAFGIKALTAARSATMTVPIVVPATSSDLIALHLIKSFDRPGGNVTGSTTFGPEIMAKRLELLKETLPGTARVAVIVNPANSSTLSALRPLGAAAKALNVSITTYRVGAVADLPRTFDAMARERMEVVAIQDDTLFGEPNAKVIAEMATKAGLASIGPITFAEAGGAIGYGAHDTALYHRGAYFIDRILRGTAPGELPVEQASRFELLLNTNTIRRLGIIVQPSVLLRAERTID